MSARPACLSVPKTVMTVTPLWRVDLYRIRQLYSDCAWAAACRIKLFNSPQGPYCRMDHKLPSTGGPPRPGTPIATLPSGTTEVSQMSISKVTVIATNQLLIGNQVVLSSPQQPRG